MKNITRLRLLLGGSALALAPWIQSGNPDIAYAETEFERARKNWWELLTGGSLDLADPATQKAVSERDSEAQTAMNNMDTGSARTSLWPDLAPMADPANGHLTLNRLVSIATAYRTDGSALQGESSVRDTLLSAFRFWAKSFDTSRSETGNWWFWEVGIPKGLTNFGVLMYADLEDADKGIIDAFINKFAPNPNVRTNSPSSRETGANRADKALAGILHGLIIEDALRVIQGARAISDAEGGGVNSVLNYVTSGDGFYCDGSFIQHEKLAYVGSYGIMNLISTTSILVTLAGTSWQVDDPKVYVLLDGIDLNYSPFVFDGAVLDSVRGRTVSRESTTDQQAGSLVAGSVLILAKSFPEFARPFQELVKGWLSRRSGIMAPDAGLPLYQAQLCRSLMADTSIAPRDPLSGHIQTPDQDRVVHHQGTWSASFSLSSNRRGRYEWGNAENQRGWYQGDGMLQVRNAADRGAFFGNYWPTSDPYHLPGVTNGQEERSAAPGAGTGIPSATQAWAGGVGWLGRLGAVGMDHKAYDGDLLAKKSWFVLEDLIICLGAGITSTKGQMVHSTIEARKLRSADQRFQVDGTDMNAALDSSSTVTGASWAHLESVGGYLFLDDSELTVKRESRTSSWYSINSGDSTAGSKDEVTDQYLVIYYDHGQNPSAVSYAYAILPETSPAVTAQRAQAPGFEVDSNSGSVQAVTIAQNNMALANFFAPGSAAGITVTQPASVVVGTDPKGPLGTEDHVVTVAAPSRHENPIDLSINRTPGVLVEYPDGATMTTAEKSFALAVPTAGSRGHALHARIMPGAGQYVAHNVKGTGVNQWSYIGSGWLTGNSDTYSATVGARATLRFRGTAIGLQSAPDPRQGIVEVSIDGGAAEIVDLFALARSGVKVVKAFTNLDPAVEHTLTVTLSAQRNPRVSNGSIAISGAVVRP